MRENQLIRNTHTSEYQLSVTVRTRQVTVTRVCTEKFPTSTLKRNTNLRASLAVEVISTLKRNHMTSMKQTHSCHAAVDPKADADATKRQSQGNHMLTITRTQAIDRPKAEGIHQDPTGEDRQSLK